MTNKSIWLLTQTVAYCISYTDTHIHTEQHVYAEEDCRQLYHNLMLLLHTTRLSYLLCYLVGVLGWEGAEAC